MQNESSTGRGGARAGAGRKAGRVDWKQIRVEAGLHSRLQAAAAAKNLNLTEYCNAILERGSNPPRVDYDPIRSSAGG